MTSPGRIPVNSHRSAAWLLLPGLPAVLSLGVGALLWAGGQPGAVGWSAVGFACAVAAVPLWVWQRNGRRFVEVLEDGFSVSDARETREYRLDQIQSAAIAIQPRYRSGNFHGMTRAVSLWIRGEWETETLSFLYKLPVGAPDPLAPLIDAIEGHLYARADEDLSRQRQVSGEGWIWERNELHVEGPMSNALSAGRTTLRIDEVEAVDTVDGHLSVWKTGDEEPAVRIPVTARNCRLLSQLLHSRLPARRGDFSSDNAAENTDGLGRMLFERRRSLLPVMLFWLLAVCVGLVSAMLFGLAIAFGDLPLWIMGGVFGLASLLLAWWGTRCRRMTFRCHEFGLCRVGPLATRTIRYRDVAIVRYRALRQFVHGTYAGTSVMLTVGTNGETRVEAVTYTTTWKRPDAELLRLRDQVATIVAQRMLDQLKAGRTVEWTPLLRFRPDALVFQPKRRLGRDKAPVTIPYDAVNQFNIDNGRFHLWTNYQERAVLAEETSEPNFYAGLIVLGHLCELPVGESV